MASVIPLSCPVCCKTFSGPVPAQQHFISQEHHKKMANASKGHTGLLYCSVCNKSCDTPKILQEHMQSPRHRAMEDKQGLFGTQTNVKINNSGGRDYVFSESTLKGYCYVCSIELTSKSHAESHINGKAHKKKTANSSLGQRNQMPPIHLSPKHSGIGQCSSQIYVGDTLQTEHQNRHIGDSCSNSGLKTNQHQLMITCDVCQVTISGTENARQHFDGEKHKKKLSQKSDPGIGVSLSCTVCGVTFTGPANEAAHMVSQKHKKKVAEAESREKGEVFPLSCEVCGCTMTGQENARDHFESAKHMKNLANKKKGPHLETMETPGKQHERNHLNQQPLQLINDNKPGNPLSSQNQENQIDYSNFQKLITKEDFKNSSKPRKATMNHAKNDTVLANQTPANVNEYSNDNAIKFEKEHVVDAFQSNYRGQCIQTPEDSLNIKPFNGDEESLNIKPVGNSDDDVGNSARFSSEEQESRDKLFLCAKMDELKIRAETYTSLSPSDIDRLSPSSIFTESSTTYTEHDRESPARDTDMDSSTNKEPFTLIKNNLFSIPSFGRGRGVFSILQQPNLPAKIVNKDQYTRDEAISDKSDNDGIYDEYNEIRKTSVWSGTLAAPSVCTPNESLPNAMLNAMYICGKKTEEQRNTGLHLSPNQEASQLRIQPGFPDVTTIQTAPNSAMQMPDKDYTFDDFTGKGTCLICEVDFTSKAHMTQHISGRNHLKAREVLSAAASGLVQGDLICNICTVTFSGPEAKQQHMQSDKHKQRELRHMTGGRDNEFFCDICKVPCSGPENFRQHIDGALHRKRAGLPVFNSETMPVNQVLDRTQWFPCDICKCSMNTRQQLEIHMQSPKHQKMLQKITTTGGAFQLDRTSWYPCNVCNCKLNSTEQLRTHESSPAHIAKMKKSHLSAQSNLTPLTIRHTPIEQQCESGSMQSAFPGCGDGMQSPLESFLSEELFPEEYLPKDVEHCWENLAASEPKETLVTTEQPFHLPPSYAPLGAAGSLNIFDGVVSSGTKRGQGSDLAFATRNKGSSTTGCKHGSPISNLAEGSPDFAALGARPKQLGTGPSNLNPYAATHKFYCHTCKAPANTEKAYRDHLRGKRHLQKVCTEPAPDRVHCRPRALPADYIPFTRSVPRSYQQELFEKSMADDTLCFLPTGTGKTLVAVMTISAMLHKYPTKNVLFLVDKVLLVLQQARYIRKEIGDKDYERFNPDSENCQDIVSRTLRIGSVCMGQQTTGGIPLWQHDVVVVTAAFCENLLSKGILKWDDFSLIVFDEAHHCEKGHPFNSLLTNYQRRIKEPQNRPKVLGLTASPAGKADVSKTLAMLQQLVMNMGGVRMSIVENPPNKITLSEYQSNADMIVKTQVNQSSMVEVKFRQELDTYIVYCVRQLMEVSNIKEYVDIEGYLKQIMTDEDVRKIAGTFVERNLDMIQSSLYALDAHDILSKIQLSLLSNHTQAICMTVGCLEEGGLPTAIQELQDMESTEFNFDYATVRGLPTAPLKQILSGQTLSLNAQQSTGSDGTRGEQSVDIHVQRLIEELTALGSFSDQKSISLVLVKQRCTAVLITRTLQNSSKMQRLGLNVTYVVGHGGSGAADTGMNVNQQKRVLEEIKQYKYQVVIATSVAEEGVDWPECERVISMYPPSTVTALVQMRGRARKKHSKFIVLCSSLDEEEKLRDIINREKNMIKATEILIEQNKK